MGKKQVRSEDFHGSLEVKINWRGHCEWRTGIHGTSLLSKLVVDP
jgi:hypothetical protein